jgi:nucleoside-diphosphate-sugar epimerase
MTTLVTGAAGFVGSHLCEALLRAGEHVRGVDVFTDYYDRSLKERNVEPLRGYPAFSLVNEDLVEASMSHLLADVEVVYHLAGQPGVRASWGDDFSTYVHHNVLATQRLLEEVVRHPIRKFVYASSSSIYGDAECFPTAETTRPQPVSPYGVTKLAAEHLCEVYRTNFGVPSVSLRLFTVYGPRQRPDMAFARLVEAARGGEPFALFGDGEQTRDFTFVADVVGAMRAAAASSWCGIANIGGGSRTSMNDVLRILRRLCGSFEVTTAGAQHGDVRHTAADTTVARGAFGYAPRTTLAAGLAQMVHATVERKVSA